MREVHCSACGQPSKVVSDARQYTCSTCGVKVFIVDPKMQASAPTIVPRALFEAPKEERVNHPKHYNSNPSGVECITVVEHMNFNVGNAMKYLWRAGFKPGADSIEDMEKAIWYTKREIERLKAIEAKEKKS